MAKGTYSYQVFACNVAGCSPASNVLVVAVDPVPGAPASVKAPSFATVNVPFAVSWSAVSGATSYTLRKTREDANNTVTIVYTGTATSTSVSSLAGIYWFAAQACNSAGCSAWTTAPNATEVQPKGSPLAVPASGSSSP